MSLAWLTWTVVIVAAGGVIVGVLFNAPIRAALKRLPLVGKYF
jgi:hypothetical protein